MGRFFAKNLEKERERLQKKIEEYTGLYSICAYCHYYLADISDDPSMDSNEQYLNDLTQQYNIYRQEGEGECEYHNKVVKYSDYCVDYLQAEITLKLVIKALETFKSEGNLDEKKLDEAIRFIKKKRSRQN